MQKKMVTLIFAIILLSTNLFSQTTNEKINKQIRDPKNAENSAKADVYVQKKMLYDSTSVNQKHQSITKRKNKRKKIPGKS